MNREPRARCQDCGAVHKVSDLLPLELDGGQVPIQDAVSAGEEMPAGRCPRLLHVTGQGGPQCGAVCHLTATRYTLGNVHAPLSKADLTLIGNALEVVSPDTAQGRARRNRLLQRISRVHVHADVRRARKGR